MASPRSIPALLRTARTAASTTAISSYRSSLSARLPGFVPLAPTRRSYADDSPPNKTQALDDALASIFKSQSPSTRPDSRPPVPSPAAPNAASSIPSRRSSWSTGASDQIFRGSSRQGRGAIFDLANRAYGGTVSEHPAGATILDPWSQLFHLHIYSTKHNTHITFTDPKKNSIISCSTGILGFRKANRHSYDAAYQLAAHVFQRIEEKGLIPKKVEVVLRGFGVGREACMKALLGKEGRYIKDVVVRLTDATRTKFGGTKSKNKRRL
ncbi:hypothetical protein H072_9739 [Dactylellina haptotyla CBS 200.50]|uniref:Translational machinery component n=1 Tax=Dactylellina haptotyla (strain CBS 200.50) TaxID=1284197 RepID=S8A119_DACHA|nr:hypothetical protein H072_9739 [Dactylellina haptotyla CBS 200.50]